MNVSGEHTRVVVSTAPDQRTAEELAGALVEAELAACVNLLPGALSIYVWEDTTHVDAEILMLIKTTAGRAADVVALIEAEHPYECPEAIVLDIAGGSQAYLEWIVSTVR